MKKLKLYLVRWVYRKVDIELCSIKNLVQELHDVANDSGNHSHNDQKTYEFINNQSTWRIDNAVNRFRLHPDHDELDFIITQASFIRVSLERIDKIGSKAERLSVIAQHIIDHAQTLKRGLF